MTTFYEIINAPLTLFLSPKEAKRGAYDLEINSDPISSETPEMTLTKKEQGQVKKVARELLETLKREKLVLDWRKTQATRAAVRVTVEDKLDELPVAFTREIYAQKCNALYQHIFESYYGEGGSMYAGV